MIDLLKYQVTTDRARKRRTDWETCSCRVAIQWIMTAKKDAVVAITSGTLVIELLVNALTFNRAVLMLGGTHGLSVVLDGLHYVDSIAHQEPGRT